MTDQSHIDETQLEHRVSALEAAVERLTSVIEPTLAVSKIAAPIAILSLKEAAQHPFSAKFFALLDIGEALLKYSTALGLAAAAQKASDEIQELFKQPPTLGKLAEYLRKVLDDTGHVDWPLDMMREVFRRNNGKPTPTARYLFEEFLRLRNDERGHGAQLAEGHYEELYLKNRLIIQDCVRACSHVKLPLVHIQAADIAKDNFIYEETLLMGGAPLRSDSVVTQTKVPVGSTCLWDYDVRLLPLSDFVSYRYCPTCGLEHIFFAERITREKLSYHSYIGNHRLTVERN